MPVPGHGKAAPWQIPNPWLRESNSVLKDSTCLISRWVRKNAALSSSFQKLSLWLARFPSPSLLTRNWYVRHERFENIGKYIHLVQLVSMSLSLTSKQCFTTFDEAKSPEISKRLSCCHHQGPIGVDQGSPSVHLMAKYLWFHIIQEVNMGERWRLRAKRPLNLTVQYAVISCWSVFIYLHSFVIYLIWTPCTYFHPYMQTGKLILTIKSISKMQIQ